LLTLKIPFKISLEMQIVSVINYKGGVGKTTVTANVAAELAFRDRKVLMIDLDPQASLTFSFVTPDYWRDNLKNDKTIKNWFTPRRGATVQFADLIFTPEIAKSALKGSGKLDLIASNLELINVDLDLATQLGGATLSLAKENFLKVHRTLINGLQQLGNEEYDIVLIDCPPNFNIVTKNALLASDFILIPAKPDYLSTMGIDYLKISVDKLIKDYNDFCLVVDEDTTEPIDPKIAGIVFTMVQFYRGQPISTIRPYITQQRRGKIPVFNEYIRENKTLFSVAPLEGIPVVLQNVKDAQHHIRTEIEAFITEFEKKIFA
jgi:chromosome partitioning protein